MKRDIENELNNWFDSPDRRPLLMRGARQVGKTYTIREFGLRRLGDLLEVNFEQRPEFASCFETLIPQEILSRLSILARREINPGKTLLFLDEIQKCPAAITALRYFYEQLPQLHVVAAGSLLDFALASEAISVPVGRVQYLYMKPLSFAEFLSATGEEASRSFVAQGNLEDPGTAVHGHILSLVNKYMIVGGMPAAVRRCAEQGDVASCADIQTSITQTFRDDFGKYARRTRHEHLEKIFVASAKMAGRRFKYASVDPDARSRELKTALSLLQHAGVVTAVRATSGSGLPLEVEANDRIFKMVFLDVGLMQNLCGLTAETMLAKDLLSVYVGALAEQFVGQELLAAQDALREPQLFFWAREQAGSAAEVDYLHPHGSRILPLEVKSGAGGTLRSARLFIDKYKSPAIIKVSQSVCSYTEPVLSVPLYAVGQIPRLLGRILG